MIWFLIRIVIIIISMTLIATSTWTFEVDEEPWHVENASGGTFQEEKSSDDCINITQHEVPHKLLELRH
jgi:hypothetical protein